jgi:hypothetical protein
MGICGACARRQGSSIEKKVKFSQVKTTGFSFENLHVADLSSRMFRFFRKKFWYPAGHPGYLLTMNIPADLFGYSEP